MEPRRKLEQQLVADMLRVLTNQAQKHHIPFSYFQIETGATAVGVPDLFFMLGGKGLWVECKRFISEKDMDKCMGSTRTVTFEGSVHFQPGQARMLTQLDNCKENVALCVLSEYGDVWVHRWHNETAYDATTARYKMHNKKGVNQPYVLEAFCTLLDIEVDAYINS